MVLFPSHWMANALSQEKHIDYLEWGTRTSGHPAYNPFLFFQVRGTGLYQGRRMRMST